MEHPKMRPELNDASRREDDGGWGAPARPRASRERPRSTSRRARRRARRGLVGAATSPSGRVGAVVDESSASSPNMTGVD